MMKLFLVLPFLALTIGCASPYQNASYTDKSTPEQRDIEASGAAAVEAARSNRSTNGNIQTNVQPAVKLSANDQYDIDNGRYVVYHNGKRDHRAELRLLQQKSQYQRKGYGSYANDRFKRQFDYKMKRKIDEEVQRVIDKIF